MMMSKEWFRDMEMASCQVTAFRAGSPYGMLVIGCTRRRLRGEPSLFKDRLERGECLAAPVCNPEMRGLYFRKDEDGNGVASTITWKSENKM